MGAGYVACMRLLFVRHAIAEDRDVFARSGQEDHLRPLTPEGRRKMKRALAGLVQVLPQVDLIATSPFTRAVQTAELMSRAYRVPAAVELAQLAPGRRPADLITWLRKQPADHTIAPIGHEPDLGQTISWFLSGLRGTFVQMKKGGACLLAFDGPIEPAAATLVWALPPSQLRALGR